MFAAREGDLLDDETGRFTYLPRLVAPARAQAWFDELRRVVEWRAERRFMYDRTVDVPRLTAHHSLAPPDTALPGVLAEAAALVVGRTGVPFTSVGLNLYRSGADSVAPHNDHLDEIAPGFPIVLLSLGATRRMALRAKPPRRQSWQLDLEPGSLFSMSYETQLHYTHAIPKTKDAVGERISLAFRVRPSAPVGRGDGRY
jgi:alkylated DNA repair dioxygenase AlkB